MSDQQFSTISIKMPRVKISHLQKNSFIYEIDVATRWARWHLQKKYTEFLQLHKKISVQFNDLPDFPTNILNYFVGENEDQASQYQQILQNYLQQTSKRKDIINSIAFIEFLQLQKHSPIMLARKPKFLYQFQMQQRINDQGKVILDFFFNQNFIVFATGNDSPIQKFNGLLANTKFPWEDDQQIEYVLPLGTIQCWIKKKDAMDYKRVWARNYPIETRSFIFSITSFTMICGLADGSIQIFKLIQKPRYIYYQMPKTIKPHDDDVIGLYLDEANMILYSCSKEGWISISDAKRCIVIQTIQMSCGISCFHADKINMRLFVALQEGNIQIFQYTHQAKLQFLYSLSPPVTTQIQTLNFDPVKNYLFSSCYESGQIFIFEIGKKGYQKLSKQIGYLKNKQKILDLIWKPQKMQLLVTNESGQIFFWNTVKGQQIYMLKAYQDMTMSKSMMINDKNMLITASRGRKIKFWQLPSTWRDTMAQIEEQRQIQIRRKVQNMYKVRQAVKRKQNNSDEDDLKGWHWAQSDSD